MLTKEKQTSLDDTKHNKNIFSFILRENNFTFFYNKGERFFVTSNEPNFEEKDKEFFLKASGFENKLLPFLITETKKIKDAPVSKEYAINETAKAIIKKYNKNSMIEVTNVLGLKDDEELIKHIAFNIKKPEEKSDYIKKFSVDLSDLIEVTKKPNKNKKPKA